MKRVIALLILMAGLLSLTACSTKIEDTDRSVPVQPEGYTFTDSLGRAVTVDEPQRVAALMGSFAHVWLLAGGELTAVTQDAFSERELDLGSEVQLIGTYKAPSLELLLASRPDLVLLSINSAPQMALLGALEEAGVPTACFSVNCFEEYLQMLDVCTQITGRRDLYDINGLAVRKQIDQILTSVPEVEAPRVLLLRASASVAVRAKNSEDTVAGVILKELGCTNIADSDTGLLDDLSMESILYQDPDFIFVVTQGADTEAALAALKETLTDNPAWAGLRAVKEGRCHVLDKQLFHYKPNDRWGESYEILANILYGATEE